VTQAQATAAAADTTSTDKEENPNFFFPYFSEQHADQK
jgi:hypothetical protein